MATPAKPTSLPTTEQDWADVSDDEDVDEAPTVQVDSLDLNSLSIDDKSKDKASTGKTTSLHVPTRILTFAEDKPPAKSLADRISMGGEETKKPEETRDDKASSLTSTTTPTTNAAPGEKNGDEKDAKEQETNLVQNRYQVAVKLQDLQADPNSPLYSVKSFEELGL